MYRTPDAYKWIKAGCERLKEGNLFSLPRFLGRNWASLAVLGWIFATLTIKYNFAVASLWKLVCPLYETECSQSIEILFSVSCPLCWKSLQECSPQHIFSMWIYFTVYISKDHCGPHTGRVSKLMWQMQKTELHSSALFCSLSNKA